MLPRPAHRVLYLTSNVVEQKIVTLLRRNGCSLEICSDPVETIEKFDLIVAFGYRHILGKQLLASTNAPVINLHISYLPFNRGAHPNFWSFYENTPSGVSIHQVDEGIDTGPILFQKFVNFPTNLTTFRQTHAHLVTQIVDLFATNLSRILTGNYVARTQRGRGSYHRIADLPHDFSGWDSDIAEEIQRLDGQKTSALLQRRMALHELELALGPRFKGWVQILEEALHAEPTRTMRLLDGLSEVNPHLVGLISRLKD